MEKYLKTNEKVSLRIGIRFLLLERAFRYRKGLYLAYQKLKFLWRDTLRRLLFRILENVSRTRKEVRKDLERTLLE